MSLHTIRHTHCKNKFKNCIPLVYFAGAVALVVGAAGADELVDAGLVTDGDAGMELAELRCGNDDDVDDEEESMIFLFFRGRDFSSLSL